MPKPLGAQPSKRWLIGFLGTTSAKALVSGPRLEALRTGLRELGYVEGKNIAIEVRWLEGDFEQLPALASELVNLKVDVLVTVSTPGAMAAKKATQTVPIVLASVGDPVATGVVSNLARPGGNITGLAIFTNEEAAKRLELLKDAFGDVRRVGVLVNRANPLWVKSGIPLLQKAARNMNLDLELADVRSTADLELAFATITKSQADALLVFEDPVLTSEARKIAALAVRYRMRAIGPVAFAEAGGLIGNGTNQLEQFRRAAGFIDKILKGAKPGDLPMEQAARFELVLNMNTATAIGVSFPKALQFRADRIIE